jgi:hypothetical protein
MAVGNTLAYYVTETIKAIIIFIEQAPNHIKLFSSVIYRCQVRLKGLAKDKHSSLLVQNDIGQSFVALTPGANAIKLFKTAIYECL